MSKPTYKIRIWKKGRSGEKTMHGHMGPYAKRKDAEQDAKAYKANSSSKVSTEIIKITPLKNPTPNSSLTFDQLDSIMKVGLDGVHIEKYDGWAAYAFFFDRVKAAGTPIADAKEVATYISDRVPLYLSEGVMQGFEMAYGLSPDSRHARSPDPANPRRPNPRWVGPNWHLRHTPKVKKGLRNLVDRLRFEHGFDYADTRAYFDHSTRDVADGSRNMSDAEFDEFMATLDESELERFRNPVGDLHQVLNHAPRENPHHPFSQEDDFISDDHRERRIKIGALVDVAAGPLDGSQGIVQDIEPDWGEAKILFLYVTPIAESMGVERGEHLDVPMRFLEITESGEIYEPDRYFDNPHQTDLFGGPPQQDIFARSPVQDQVVQVYRIKEKGPFVTSRDTFADEISADAARRRVQAETYENENRDLMIRFTGKKRDVLDLLAPLTYSARLVRAPLENTEYGTQHEEAAQIALQILKDDVMSNAEVDRLHENEAEYRDFVERQLGEFYEGDPNRALRDIADAVRKAMADIGAKGYVWFVPDDLLIVDEETATGKAEQGDDIYELDRGDLVQAVTGDRTTAYRFNPKSGIPESAIRPVLIRIENAKENFLQTIMDRGFSRAEAESIFQRYRKMRLLKRDLANSRYTVVHGRLLDQDVLQRAVSGEYLGG